MSIKNLAVNSAGYNLWVTKEYINWLSSKPEELLYKEVPSSFPSIIKTLNHIWGTQEYWCSIIAQTKDFIMRFGVEDLKTDEIFSGLLANSEKLVQAVQALDEEALVQPIEVKNQWFTSNEPCYNYLLHAVHHGIYHRGQIVTMGRGIGITDAPMTDYNFYNVRMAGKQI